MIRIGTRSSPLALIQASLVRDALALAHPHKRIELIPFTTRGDQTTKSLHDIGGKALFTKELQDALLTNTIDAAVHSLKDVELHDFPLALGAYLPREAPNDVLITRKNYSTPASLARDARVHDQAPEILTDGSSDYAVRKLTELVGTLGTCSPRRASQAKLAWPNITIADLRGNVGTRLQHVVDGKIDATILAAAGLIRLGLAGDVFAEKYPTLQQTILPIETFIPAAGQGVIAVECRPNDAALFAPISDADTAYCAQLERQFSKHLGGCCRTALGAHVRFLGDGSTSNVTKEIEVLSFFEGRTLTRTFSVGADYSEEIRIMAKALKE
ncbi:MAG: hydroxymethylbilane synthase [Pseudomonadota bacterium]|nr:hydroxymethylbilane synthase [Alphaproteobacteria bacterium]MDP5370284.1 hydroxymethylbilane synthase [Pseudomonadota bacterium]